MARHPIIDNKNNTVVEHLKHALSKTDKFSFVSVYFTIYGYALLADELDNVGRTRFLFGDPNSVESLDPGEGEPKAFDLTERGLEPKHILQQKALALQCKDWVAKRSVSVRSVSQSNFLHGKMYLTEHPKIPTSLVGSSNFTKSGLGGSSNSNLEINIAMDDPEAVSEHLDWFNNLWNDKRLTKDVKKQVLDALERIGGDYAPEAVYYKTLYELFRQSIEDRLAGDATAATAGFKDSQIWNILYAFQRDGARSVIAKLKEHNGCILADSVGLGKTYTALAVIKYFELLNERVLVLSPKKLFENWSLYPAANNHKHNPFDRDRFAYTLLAHTDLSRDSGFSGGVNLETFNWSNYDLVVIDESHNFRNHDGQRYKRLLEEVIKSGTKTKVLMLSATPVNTSFIDLRNQIYLMTEGRQSAFEQSLGVRNIGQTMSVAQRQFKRWDEKYGSSTQRNKDELLESLGADFLRLLSGVSISRSRRQIELFYAEDMDRVGRFPKRAKPVNEYPPTDLHSMLSYEEIANRIADFKLAVYQPSAYLIDDDRRAELITPGTNFRQVDREKHLVNMLLTNFLKRLESSPRAFRLTLERTLVKIEDILNKIEKYEVEQYARAQDFLLDDDGILPEEDDDDEDLLVNRRGTPYHLRDLNLTAWRDDLEQDKVMLSDVLGKVKMVTQDRDGKLQLLRQTIRHKTTQPTQDRDGNHNRKLLVFTTFKDTARYLYDNLRGLAADLGIEMGMVSGDETHATCGAQDFNSILTNFAPIARAPSRVKNQHNIELLIATDCISEGQNLQDCDTVVNYDIHWNPVRLVQRFGRIDRIGSRNNIVRMVNYWPTADMEEYLNLIRRVRSRMIITDLAASGDENILEQHLAQQTTFRDEQLRTIREQVLDIEEMDDGPTLGDFTLDHFFTQLLRYIEANRDELERMPNGIYALTNAVDGTEVRPGVIFFLRQRNAESLTSRQRPASPVHPYYFVYILDNGNIRYGCGNAKQALSVFDAATSGHTAPITELCDRFDQETNHGRDMAQYDNLLSSCIAHIRQSHNSTQMQSLRAGGGREFILPTASETPQNESDFQLLTWLVIKDEQEDANNA